MPKVALHKTITLPKSVLTALESIKDIKLDSFDADSQLAIEEVSKDSPYTVADIAAKTVLSWVQSFLANSEESAVDKAASVMQSKLALAGIALTLDACRQAVRNAIPKEGAES